MLAVSLFALENSSSLLLKCRHLMAPAAPAGHSGCTMTWGGGRNLATLARLLFLFLLVQSGAFVP